jgi:AcrR family transcriptional regulator
MSQKKSRMTDSAENRKIEIIDRALKLFAKNGYHSTTLDQVAANIGVTKATLYYYFRSKEEIIRAILKRSVNRMEKAVELGKSSLSAKDKLCQFIQYHVEFSADNAELARVTFEQINALPKKTRDAIKRKQREVMKTLERILEQGIRDKSFDAADIKIVSFAIIGLCNWTYHWYKPDGRLTPQQISKIYINLLEKGYLKTLSSKEKQISPSPAGKLPNKALPRKKKQS